MKSSPLTNQHPTFYRPDALPVAQSKRWRKNRVWHTCQYNNTFNCLQQSMSVLKRWIFGFDTLGLTDWPVSRDLSWPDLVKVADPKTYSDAAKKTGAKLGGSSESHLTNCCRWLILQNICYTRRKLFHTQIWLTYKNSNHSNEEAMQLNLPHRTKTETNKWKKLI